MQALHKFIISISKPFYPKTSNAYQHKLEASNAYQQSQYSTSHMEESLTHGV